MYRWGAATIIKCLEVSGHDELPKQNRTNTPLHRFYNSWEMNTILSKDMPSFGVYDGGWNAVLYLA